MAGSCFESEPNFCPDCGSVLPLPGAGLNVTCGRCCYQISIDSGAEVFVLRTRGDGVPYAANAFRRRRADCVLHVSQLQAPRKGGLLMARPHAASQDPRQVSPSALWTIRGS
ncbi:DNA-directed RNA polymerase I subunit RPA12 isoform X2 [Narcine bancroftii]|uniref:DNA-directed RNA polymerase I subunit RPA12 isoform X2 n=1 Tax=Narcine bancroftii TaxID=1343680 RepID=UPI00383188AD